MSDSRRHRGPHPRDGELFAPVHHAALKSAVGDLSHLLSLGYPPVASLKLVGDRFSLTERQRLAVRRCVCSDLQLANRLSKQVSTPQLVGERVVIDGFNLLTTIEAALAGGVLLRGRDGCLRDMASMHGSYRRVEETLPALELIGRFFSEWQMGPATWLLDEPVSNSGRLKTMIETLARERNWSFSVVVVPNPDPLLVAADEIAISADSEVLDACQQWLNAAWLIVHTQLQETAYLDFTRS